MSNWHDRHRTAYDREHECELRHDEPRPGEKGYVAHRLDVAVFGAMEVALIVKGLPNISDAASLIETYAQTVASEARLQATIDTSNHVFGVLDALNGKVSA